MTEETRTKWSRAGHWVTIDCAVAVLSAAGYALAPHQVPGAHTAPWLGSSLAVAACLPLSVRRRYPLGVTVVVLIATATDAGFGFTKVPYLALAYALYALAARRPSRTAFAALAGAGVAVMIYLVAGSLYQQGDPVRAFGDRFTAVSGSAVAIPAAFAMGFALRAHRRYAAGTAEQAERRTAARLTEERLRIARELHDVVAHSMSVIAVQAGVGNYLLDEQPGQARHALGVIETTSREALAEMRYLLGVLRDGDDGGKVRLHPVPGVGELEGLALTTTEAGTTTEITVTGERRPLPAGLDLTVYRIVQEALTNVVKHAGARHCSVSLHYGQGELVIDVVDDGSGGDGMSRGHGLTGMRERLSVYSGHLTAGPSLDAERYRCRNRSSGDSTAASSSGRSQPATTSSNSTGKPATTSSKPSTGPRHTRQNTTMARRTRPRRLAVSLLGGGSPWYGGGHSSADACSL